MENIYYYFEFGNSIKDKVDKGVHSGKRVRLKCKNKVTCKNFRVRIKL